MAQQVAEESNKVNLEKSVAIKEENSVTFKVTSVEDLVEYVEYNNEVLNEDYINLSPATVMLASPAAVVGALGRAVSSLRTTVLNLDNLSNWKGIADFFGDLYKTGKAIIVDIKDGYISSAFFDALSGVSDVIGKVTEKLTKLDIPFFGLASSMAQYESSQLKAQKEYSSNGSVQYETLDDMVTNGIDVIDGIVKLASFFVPKGFLATAGFLVLTDVVAAGFKTFYLKCISPNPDNKGKGILFTFFEQMFEGVFEIVSDIQNLISGGENAVDSSSTNTIIDTSTNKKYTRTADSSLTISNQNGSETVFNMNTSTTVSTITVGLNSTVYNYTSGVSIIGSDGNDKIYNFGSNVTINGGKGSDTIYNEGNNVTIKISGGNNSIYNTGSNVTIEGSEGTDTIESYGDNVTIKDAGGSKNYILVSSNTNATNHIYLNDTSGGYNTVYGGKGNDYVSIAGSSQRNLISVGGGNDTVVVNDEYTTINAGQGNNRVSLNSSKNTKVIGGSGDDLIMMDSLANENNILLYGGNNKIYGAVGRHTVTTGNGDDSIVVGSGYVNAASGDNSVVMSSGTVNSGAGNDLVTISSGYVSVGDGKNNILVTEGGKRSTIISGNDDDTIRVADIDETEGMRYHDIITAGDGDNYIYNSNVELSTISAGSGNDTIVTGGGKGYKGYDDKYGQRTSSSGNGYHATSINAGTGDNQITVNTALSNGTILTGNGNDYISIYEIGSGNYIRTDGGNDTLIANISNSTLRMGTNGNNRITLQGNSNSNNITMGAGNNLITMGGTSTDNIISLGEGNNTIYGAKGRQSITAGDKSTFVTIGSGYVSVGNGGNNISLTTAQNRNSIISGDADDIINVADFDENEDIRYHSFINAGACDNYIYNSNVELSTINAGTGNDTIVTGGGKGYKGYDDKYGQRTSSSGNGYHATSINAGTGDNQITVNTALSNGTILTGNGNDFISVANASNNNIIYAGDGDNTVYAGRNTNTVTVGSGNDNVTVGGGYINVGEGNNNVSIANSNSTVISGEGDDTVYSLSSEVYIYASEGNNLISIGSLVGGLNKLIVGNGSDTIIVSNIKEPVRYHNNIEAGDGDNYIYNSNVELSTISAGTGNDTIVTGGGKGYKGYDNKYGQRTSSSGNGYHATSINAGTGDNQITVNTALSNGTILTGNGNDYISIYEIGSGNYIRTDGGNDTLIANISNSTLRMGTNGNNRITLQGNSNSNNITMGAGDNFITMGGNSTGNVVSLGEGNNTIYGAKGRQSITAGDKSTFVTIGSGYVSAGNGGNNISLTAAGNRSSVISGDANDVISVMDLDANADTRYHDYIIAGEGNNYIYNSNVELSTISAGNGNDTIVTGGGEGYEGYYDKYSNRFVSVITQHSTSINAGAGDNKITVNTALSNGYVYAGSGNDYVTIAGNGSNNLITLGGGRNTIYSGTGSSNKIITGNGSDVIIAGGNYNSIRAGSGRNYVSLIGGNNSIITGGGNDTIALAENSGGNVIIFGGGNDLVQNYHSTDTIKYVSSVTTSTVGNDVILTSGSDKMTLKGARDKTINLVAILENIDTTSGDTVAPEITGQPQETLPPEETLQPDDSRLTYNSEKTAVTLSSDFTGTLNASDYVATTKNIDAAKVTKNINIYGNALKNSIIGGSGSDTLNGGTGNDTLTGGAGKDIFVHSYGRDIITDYVVGADKIKIEDGEVFDYRVIGADVILYTDNGSVRVKNGKDKKITVIDADGNETTETYKAEEIATVPPDTISAGISIKGAVLTISTVFSGSALNLENYDATVTNVNAKALNKSITITGTKTNNSLVGGAGADTISGGSGNDTLTGNAGKDIYIYTSGNDVITDYKTGEDKIKLMNSSITGASVSGSNVILNTSGGSITVKNVNGKNITVIDSSGKETSNIYPIDTMPVGLTYDAKKTLITATSKFTGNKIDLANFEATVTKINASALSKGVDIVGNTANNSLQGGKGADTISGGAGKDTILGGNGNDSILGGADNDILKGEGGNDTLNGGTDNDTLTGGAGNDVFVYEGGNDVITDYATGQNTIKLATGTIINSSLKSSDIILTTANGSITVKNGKDKKITVTDGNGNTTTEVYGRFNYNSDKSAINLASTFTGSLKSGDYASSVKTINAASVTKSSNIIGNTQNNTIIGGSAAEIISGGTGNDSIIGNSGNDKIYGDAGSDTLNGGKGNDTLTGGDGADVFFYASGEGNDVIVDFTAGQDSINLTNGTIASASLKSSDMVFKIGSGTLTVKNGKNQEIAIGNSIYYNNLVYDKNKSVITIGAGFSGLLKSSDYVTTVKTINAGGVTKSTNIIGNAQDNTIIGSSKAETISGGTGNDSIIGNACNDKIYGDAGNDKLLGGEGNDSLYGGTGNDTLTGEKGNDVFVYEGGNDLITDYTAGQDKIKINSGNITKTGYNGNAVTFTVGSGTITVQNGKGKKITIIDANNKTTTQTYTQDVSYKAASNARWFTADDNNFITDEIQISDIAKMQESNYSAIQANVVENKNELAITDAVFSAISSDKK